MDNPRESARRLEWLLIAGVVTLTIFSLAVLLIPGFHPAALSTGLDVAINTATTLIAAGVAALAWGRYREARQVAALYQASAFLLLAVVNLTRVARALIGPEAGFGLGLEAPGQLPVYVSAAARLTAALLLAVGASVAWRRFAVDQRGGLIVLLVPTIALVALVAVAIPFQHLLPPLLGAAAVEHIASDPTAPLGPGLVGPLGVIQGLIGAVYLGAAYLYLLLHRRDGRVGDAYLAFGLVTAAFSQVHVAIHPGVYASLVTSGDVLRVAFYGILLLGVHAESRADMRAVRQANAELRHLHATELARTALEERARLAREVHDGLAQDLWYAKLKQGRLARLADLSAEARQLVSEVAGAVDDALSEARQAVMALRPHQLGADSFRTVLARYVDDFADRFGLRAELEGDETLPAFSPRAQAELLRIVQEAMNNTRRHADATMIRVSLTADEERLRVQISDNGQGFNPDEVNGTGYGLQSMRERAAIIGGSLVISAAPQDGATVTVELPLDTPAPSWVESDG